MSSGATVGELSATAEATTRPAIRNAGRVLLVAAGLGLLGQLLFFDVGLGINFPIAIALLLSAGWLLRDRRARMELADAWLAPAALVFAWFAAFRADATIVALDVLTALTLAGAALATFAGRRVSRRSLERVIGLALGAIGWVVAGAVPALADARRELPSSGVLRHRAAPAMPVLRGLAIALPVVVVFVALFSAADAVFARVVDDLFGIELDVGDAAWRLFLAAVFAWLAAGALAFAATPPAAEAPNGGDPAARRRFGITEALTVLIAVDFVFVIFVALQAAYLFGGLDTLEAAGMTYAEYARRGFFELVAVAMLAGALVIGADRWTRERSRPLIVAAVALAALTAVVLVSAALRLRLYQEAYGWTELRLYVLATIALLSIGIGGLLVALVSDRVRWIGHVIIIGALAIGIVLNAIGPVRFITEQNVARLLDPALVPPEGSTGLDEAYAASLGDDAIPSLVRALPALHGLQREYLAGELSVRLEQLRLEEGLNAWQAWNAGREAAREALHAAGERGELPIRP